MKRRLLQLRAILLIALFSVCPILLLYAQEYTNPFDFPAQLSGNFGELRSNHFHSGIDFRTQQVEGKPIHVVQGGYISRISVSPGGYGNALYVTHPDGTTTVYGHIQRFVKTIADYVKEQQYKEERFAVNLTPEADLFVVEQGEVIAFSGNTGSSGGPHLHFEVRDTRSEELLDPLAYYMKLIEDTRPPRIQGVMFFPVEGKGVVNGSSRKQAYTQIVSQDGQLVLGGKTEAWGKIGLAVKAYDYMDHTHNIYGVKNIRLKVDGKEIFSSRIDRFTFGESRYLNSFIDYADWVENRSFYMKSFVEPGNRLRFYETKNRGYVLIDEERTYQFEYILSDIYGNETRLLMAVEGKEQAIPEVGADRERFYWSGENRFGAKGVRLTIPKGNLYDDLYFSYRVVEDSLALSSTHILHDSPLALHRNGLLSLRLLRDSLENKQQYGVVRINKGRYNWIGGAYRNGWVDATIRELGSYTLAVDSVPPSILPVDPTTWKKRQRLVFHLTDNLSGVGFYRGEIDGNYALFEMNNRSVITYRFDRERLLPGEHTLLLRVKDGCGNESTYTCTFNL